MESSAHIPQASNMSPASSISSSNSSSSSCSSTPATLPSIQQRQQQQYQLQQYVEQQKRISLKNSFPKSANSNTISSNISMSGSPNTPNALNYSSPTLPKLIPRNFFECATPDIIILVSSMLQELVVLNDALPFDAQNLTRFHSRSQPPISIVDYLARITKFCSLEKSIIMAMIYYIDLLCTTYKTFNINSLTVHRFLITSAMVASKGLCDTFCTNTHYAKVGGLSRAELNLLEVEFLIRVDYRIVPPADRLNQYFERMVRRLSHKYKFQDSHLKQQQHQVPHHKTPARDINVHGQTPANLSKPESPSTSNGVKDNYATTTTTTTNNNNNNTTNISTTVNTYTSPAPTSETHSQHYKNTSAPNGVVLASEIALREGRQNMSSKLKRRSTTTSTTTSATSTATKEDGYGDQGDQEGNLNSENMVDNNGDRSSTDTYTNTQNPFNSMNNQTITKTTPTSTTPVTSSASNNCSDESRHSRAPSKIRIGADTVIATTMTTNTTNSKGITVPKATYQGQLSREKSRNECANFNTNNNNNNNNDYNTIMTSNEINDQTNTNTYNTTNYDTNNSNNNKTLLAISTLKDLTPEELQQVHLQLQKQLADSNDIMLQQQQQHQQQSRYQLHQPYGFNNPFRNQIKYETGDENEDNDDSEIELFEEEEEEETDDDEISEDDEM